jgi:hypothetical protein
MDFYDYIFQYDLEIENKIMKRLDKFLKLVNILKNENPLNISNSGDFKYNHITNIFEEIKTSNKFKNKLFANKKKNLLLRMNNKTKVNSKYYIYAKNMNQNNCKMDIIEVKNNLIKKDDSLNSSSDNDNKNNHNKKEKINNFCEIFNQKKISQCNNDNEESIENENIKMLKSDTIKILCDMIKQNVKNIYKKKLNEIIIKNQNNRNNKDKDSIEISFNKSKEIKNNNYVKIDLSRKEEKERKLHSNHSSEKNNFMKYLLNNKKNNQINKDLRNSATNNNGNNLKIKVCSDIILNLNNLNNGNTLNNLLIVNKKVKSVKNDNYNHNMKIKKRNQENEEQKEIMDYTHKNSFFSINNNNNNNLNISKNTEKEEDNEAKLYDQTLKKLNVRNMQRIHIKNVKLKENQTGYNLTNFRKKQVSNLENININNNNNNNKNLSKKNKQKNMNFASPSDFIIDGKTINKLKFKLGKNYISPNRKITDKSSRRNKNLENSKEKDNSTISLFDNKTRDNLTNEVKFNSVRKKKLSDKISCNEGSAISREKKINENIKEKNFPIRNYKTNFNLNNINLNNINNGNEININYNVDNNNNDKINFPRKELEEENYFIINRNIKVKKSLSKEAASQPQLPWGFSNSNTNTIMNKSNNKGNIGNIYLNHMLQAEKKNNANYINNINNNNFENNLKNEININKNNNIYKDIIIKNKKGLNYQYFYEQKQEKSAKNRKLRNNFRKNDGYHDTIDNKGGEKSNYKGAKIKGKKRILSTRVHIHGIKSSKNFNDI